MSAAGDADQTGVLRRSALGHRDFALLWSGQSVSLIGDGILTVALALETLDISHSSAALSVVLAARLIPTVVLLLVGGVIVDRVPRRLAMLASDLSRTVVVGVVAALIATGHVTVGELIVMAVVFGSADALFYPASTAIVPELVPDDLLVNASALNSTSKTLAEFLIGPALGGVIVAAAGTAWSFGLDGVSFLVSATCLAVMRTRTKPERSEHSALSELRAGLRYCATQPWLWATVAGAGLANFAAFSPVAVLVPLLVRQTLHQGALALGLALAAGGLGGGLAALVVAKLGQPRHPVPAMWAGWGLGGLGVSALAAAHDVAVLAVIYFTAFALVTYGNVLWYPLLQRRVPTELIGRVSSVDWVAGLGLSPLGVLAAGAAAGGIGVRETLLIGGLIATVTPAVLLIPGVRNPDSPAPPSTLSDI